MKPLNSLSVQETDLRVLTGADRLLTEMPDVIRGKRVGILTNHTGRCSDGQHIIDAIVESRLATVTALYGPEHGITGEAPDGTAVDHQHHTEYNIPVYSLYGKTHKPTPAMLHDIDVLLCDIQDVGARFYTYISTVALALEAAGEAHIPFLLLDRPNPIRGLHFDGPVRTASLRSFVGWMPIPVTHGMTLGELATLWNEEGWLARGVQASLTVVPLRGWKRSFWFDQTGLRWIPPSPNIPTVSTAILYPGLCFVEGTSISEGRGTPSPFHLIGAPWANPERVIAQLQRFNIAGVSFVADEFTPQEIPGVATRPKYEGVRCRGVRISVVDRNSVEPVKLGIAVLAAFKRAHPTDTVFRHRRLDILTGNSSVRHQLERNAEPEEIFDSWKDDIAAFGRVRAKYLLYEE